MFATKNGRLKLKGSIHRWSLNSTQMGPEKMGSSELGRNVQSLSNENWTLYPFFATRQKPCRQLLQKVKSKSDQSDFQALVNMRSRHFACLRGVQMAWVDARSSAASSAAVSPAPWQISKMQSFKTATSAFP